MQQYRNNRNNGNIYDLRKDLQHTPPPSQQKRIFRQCGRALWLQRGTAELCAGPHRQWYGAPHPYR